MPTTLLTVDDSVTMQKVLEITFASEDVRLVTADSGNAALQRARAERPAIALVDVTLPDQDGYALCKALKAENPTLRVVILSSKQGPYDPTRGASSGADDFIDKPFDTQQIIDKVRKLSSARVSSGAPVAQPSLAPAQPSIAPETAAAGGAPAAPAARASAVPVPNAAPTSRQAPVPNMAPTGRQPQGTGGPAAAEPLSLNAPRNITPATHGGVRPAPAYVGDTAPSMPSPVLSHVADRVTDRVADRVASLGLSAAQAEAVMALSRDIVERVVWEVVPALAESMIKEEIRRLMREGEQAR